MLKSVKTPKMQAEEYSQKMVFRSAFANLMFLRPLCWGALVRGYAGDSVFFTALLVVTPILYAILTYVGAKRGGTPVRWRAVVGIQFGCFAVWCLYLSTLTTPPVVSED